MVYTTTSKKEEKRRKREKDEEREVPDPRESIEDTPTVHFHLVSSKSDFREPSFEQTTNKIQRNSRTTTPTTGKVCCSKPGGSLKSDLDETGWK